MRPLLILALALGLAGCDDTGDLSAPSGNRTTVIESLTAETGGMTATGAITQTGAITSTGQNTLTGDVAVQVDQVPVDVAVTVEGGTGGGAAPIGVPAENLQFIVARGCVWDTANPDVDPDACGTPTDPYDYAPLESHFVDALARACVGGVVLDARPFVVHTGRPSLLLIVECPSGD